jgi:hypothetical protein
MDIRYNKSCDALRQAWFRYIKSVPIDNRKHSVIEFAAGWNARQFEIDALELRLQSIFLIAAELFCTDAQHDDSE